MKLEETFGKIVKNIRCQKGLSQDELSEKTGLDRTFISQIENGQRNPSLSTILKISEGLNIKPSALISKFEISYLKSREENIKDAN